MKLLADKFIEKNRRLFAAFINLERTYDRADRKELWDVLRIYGVGELMLRGI